MMALLMVQKHYGDRVALRSGVPLINHIHEGLDVLRVLWAPVSVQEAWCLHPMMQADEDLEKVADQPFYGVSTQAVINAMEYRNRANAWLSDKVEDWSSYDSNGKQVVTNYCLAGKPTPGPLPGVRQMLVADKVQNYKDFLVHHKGTHPRSDQLEIYFQAWFIALGVTDEAYAMFDQAIELGKRIRAA